MFELVSISLSILVTSNSDRIARVIKTFEINVFEVIIQVIFQLLHDSNFALITEK